MTTARCYCALNKLLIESNFVICATTSKLSLLYGKYRLSVETVNGNKTLKYELNFNRTFKQVLTNLITYLLHGAESFLRS